MYLSTVLVKKKLFKNTYKNSTVKVEQQKSFKAALGPKNVTSKNFGMIGFLFYPLQHIVDPLNEAFKKTEWEKEKILVTSTFSFSHNLF